jgi:hypothetical protein
VLLPLERLITAVGNVARIISERVSFACKMIGRVVDTQSIRAWKLLQRTGRVEALLERWEVAMFLAVLLGVALTVVAIR